MVEEARNPQGEWEAQEERYKKVLPELYRQDPRQGAMVELIHGLAQEERTHTADRLQVRIMRQSPGKELAKILKNAEMTIADPNYTLDDLEGLVETPRAEDISTIVWQYVVDDPSYPGGKRGIGSTDIRISFNRNCLHLRQNSSGNFEGMDDALSRVLDQINYPVVAGNRLGVGTNRYGIFDFANKAYRKVNGDPQEKTN